MSPISPLPTPATLVSPTSPLSIPATFVAPISPLPEPTSEGTLPSIVNPSADNWLPWILVGVGGLVVLSTVALLGQLMVQVLEIKRRLAIDPQHLYTLLYTNSNTLRKRLQFALLSKLLELSQDPVAEATARVARVHSASTRQAGASRYSFRDWMSALQARERLTPSDLGGNLLQLCLILERASEKKTFMQIAEFDLNVGAVLDDTIIVYTRDFKAHIDADITDSIQSDLVALGQISRAIREYVAKVVDNAALGQLEKIIASIQALDLSVEANTFEGRFIQQVVEKWRGIGQREIARIPYIAGRPVTETELFFGRDPELDQIVHLLQSNYVAIWGPRRIGKTSILHQLQGRLLIQPEMQYRFLPVFINVEPLKSSKLFHPLIKATVHSLEQFSIDCRVH